MTQVDQPAPRDRAGGRELEYPRHLGHPQPEEHTGLAGLVHTRIQCTPHHTTEARSRSQRLGSEVENLVTTRASSMQQQWEQTNKAFQVTRARTQSSVLSEHCSQLVLNRKEDDFRDYFLGKIANLVWGYHKICSVPLVSRVHATEIVCCSTQVLLLLLVECVPGRRGWRRRLRRRRGCGPTCRAPCRSPTPGATSPPWPHILCRKYTTRRNTSAN